MAIRLILMKVFVVTYVPITIKIKNGFIDDSHWLYGQFKTWSECHVDKNFIKDVCFPIGGITNT